MEAFKRRKAEFSGEKAFNRKYAELIVKRTNTKPVFNANTVDNMLSMMSNNLTAKPKKS
jgi:hypothetical protein